MAAADGEAPKPRDDGLLLDQIEEQLERTRRLLTEGPEGAAERVLARMGKRTAFESKLVATLADHRAIAHPDQFDSAHRLALQAIEIYDRDGWKHPEIARLGPLTAVLEYLAELAAKYIARSFTADAVRAMARLYTRREAQAETGSDVRNLLLRARLHTDRVAAGYGGGASVVPTALIGGAAVPLLAGVARAGGGLHLRGVVFWLVIGALAAIFALAAYALLQGAAVARRRAKLVCEQPLAALWEAVGSAGHPPKDDATTFAAIAIVLTFLAWFVLPAVAGILVYFKIV